jgi:D-beta-D-heptose 7-phosphate kinase/D-beta-D-heptose 1-phosphate adenosyltransferase
LGRDPAGDEVRAAIRATPRVSDAHVASDARRTTCKTRYIAAHQQIMRVDDEEAHALDPTEETGLRQAIATALPNASAIVLSDYGKGVLTRRVLKFAIDRAKVRGIPVFIDPKSDDYRTYRGATCITPNQAELARAANMPVGSEAEVAAAATKVLREAQAEAILVTRSDKGMLLVEASGPGNYEVHVEPARAREVFDVSGAGDTVIGVLALAHACGHALPEAMRLANTAAGIVVSKLGTATVELDELMLELSRDVRDKEWHRAKYYSAAEAETLVRRWKSRGLAVGFTNGCFDIVHAGHVALLASARAHCDRLIVALNTDPGVRRLKGPQRPVNGLADRSAVIAAVEAVDAVISFDDDTPIELIRRLKPDVLVKGGDYTIDAVVGAAEVEAAGGRVVLVDLVEGHSTTRLIDTIRAGDAPAAAGRARRAPAREDAG